jgi:plastocyanin
VSRRAGLRLTVAALAIASTFFGAGAGRAEPVEVVVHITNFAFDPSPATVTVGDTVKWHVDEGIHAFASDDGVSFRSPDRMYPGQEYSWTPSAPGSYGYHSRYYRRMSGVIEVVAPPDPGPDPTTTTTTTAPPPPTTTTTVAPPPPPSGTTTTTRPPAAGGGTTTTTRPDGTTSTTAPRSTPTTFSWPSNAAPDPSTTGAARLGRPAPAPAGPDGPAPEKASKPSKGSRPGPGRHHLDGGDGLAAGAALGPDGLDAEPAEVSANEAAPPGAGGVPEVTGASTLPSLVSLALPALGGPATAEPPGGGGGHRSAALALLLLALAVLGGAGSAWYHRSSRYLPA